MTERNDIKDVPIRYKRWTAGREQAFLEHLAATCNVGAACGVVNVAAAIAYRQRRQNPAFAAAWRAALLTGYDRLEAMLLARAGAATADAEAAVEAGALDAELAIKLLQMHDARMRAQDAGRAKPQNRITRATPEQTDAAILKQLAALDRRLKAKATA